MKKYYTDSFGKSQWKQGRSFFAFDWEDEILKEFKGKIYSFSFTGPLVPRKNFMGYFVTPGTYQITGFTKVRDLDDETLD